MSEEAVALDPKSLPNQRVPIILVRTEEDEVAAFSSEPIAGWLPIAEATLKKGLFGPGASGPGYGRYFTMRARDLNAWDALTHHGPGDGFAYAVGWSDSGKISKVFCVKEVPPPPGTVPGIDPLTLANAVAIAQLQASIARLTDLVKKMSFDLRDVLTFLHNEQQANVLAAVETVDDIYDVYAHDATVYRTDWLRIVSLEQVLKQQHRQVLLELEEIAQDLTFRDIPTAERSLQRHPERVGHLITLEYYLLRAMHRWTALMLAWKESEGELTSQGVSAGRATTERYTKHARATMRNVRVADSDQIQGRGFFELLFSDGLVVGAQKDKSLQERAKDNRAAIRAVVKTDALPMPTKRRRLTPAA